MGCNCGKPKCDGKCGISPAVLQINNPSECVIFHKVDVPASMGDSTTNPPKTGAYKNVLLYYEADQTSWLYSSDGIPVRLTNGITNYEDAINLPQINGETLIGNKSSADLKLADVPMVITIASGNTSWSGADTAEDIYNFFLNQGNVNVVFEGSENYGYGIVSAAYIPGEQKMMCVVAVAGVDTGSSPVEFGGNALYGLMTFYTAGKAVDVGALDLQPKLFVADFTGLNIIDGYVLEGVPATGFSIGMVKPGDGLEVASDGTLSVNAEVTHTFDTVADMKASTVLKVGDVAQTLGFHALNDGGGATYYITNTGTANEMDVIAVGDLYANLVTGNEIDVKQFGAYGDNTHDDTTAFQNAFNYASDNRLKVNIGAGVFKFGNGLNIPSGLVVNGNGTLPFINTKGSVLVYTGNDTFITTGANAVLNNFSVDLSNSGTAIGINLTSTEAHNINVRNGNIGFIMGTNGSPSNLLEKCLAYNCTTGYKLDSSADNTKYCNNTVLFKCHANGCTTGVHINCYDIRAYDLSVNDTKSGGTSVLMDGRAVACYFSGTYFENPSITDRDIVFNAGADRNIFTGFRNFGWIKNITDNSGVNTNIIEGYRQGNPNVRYTQGRTASEYIATWATADKNRIFGTTYNGTDNHVVEKVLSGGGTVIKHHDSSVIDRLQEWQFNCRSGYSVSNLGFVQAKPAGSITSITIPANDKYMLQFSSSYWGTTATSRFVVGVDVSNPDIVTSYQLDGTTLKVYLRNMTGTDITLSSPQDDVKINIVIWEV